ncbi:PREDICTED: target of rapamycin complex subunit lst8-like [Acropora digitifera]|uniref:target of rapamycin complex subunit lst8-like n=1 Tax=Acropora digitifera TaxID=70779 RepID=UPI00077AEE4E|nr:PREDICTED: target of rapamycin complex subunit lst8-like [Acropora digitifera]
MTETDGSSEAVILATAGYDHAIKFWQAHSGICHRTVQHPDSQVNAMQITPDRQLLAAAGYQHIRMYDINSSNPNPVVNYDGVSKNVTAVGFHEDGKWMYTGGEDCSARIWDLRSRNLQCQRVFQVNAPVNCVCLHPNQVSFSWCFAVVFNKKPEVWIIEQHVFIGIKTHLHEYPLRRIGTAIDLIFFLILKGNCYVWSLTGGTRDEPTVLHPRTKIPQAHKRAALKCLFSPDSCFLATTSADTTVNIWQTSDFSLKKTLKEANQRWVWDCAFSEDSQYLITASSDNMARLWNLDHGEVVREYSGHQKAVVSLAFRDAHAV